MKLPRRALRGSALPNLRVPARALPAHPTPALAPSVPRVSPHLATSGKSQRQGVGRSGHTFSGGPGRRGGGGGAERRRPASGRNSKLRWKSSGWIKEEKKPGVCGTTKVQGVNFSVRGIVYPMVVHTLSPACTVESPGKACKIQMPRLDPSEPLGQWRGWGLYRLHFSADSTVWAELSTNDQSGCQERVERRAGALIRVQPATDPAVPSVPRGPGEGQWPSLWFP